MLTPSIDELNRMRTEDTIINKIHRKKPQYNVVRVLFLKFYQFRHQNTTVRYVLPSLNTYHYIRRNSFMCIYEGKKSKFT